MTGRKSGTRDWRYVTQSCRATNWFTVTLLEVTGDIFDELLLIYGEPVVGNCDVKPHQTLWHAQTSQVIHLFHITFKLLNEREVRSSHKYIVNYDSKNDDATVCLKTVNAWVIRISLKSQLG